jgi:intracellular multiplication protein IcmP
VSDKENTGYHNAMGWALLSCVGFALALLFWHFQSQNVRDIIRWIRLGEMWVSSLFYGNDHMISVDGVEIATLGQIREQISQLDKSQLTPKVMDLIAVAAISPLRYIYTGILFLMGLWALFKGPKSSYRRKLDLNTLIKRQAGNFPALNPFVTFNPNNQPARAPGTPVPAELPAFAEALGPEEWIAYNDIPVPSGKVDEGVAARAFSKQLGPLWRGTMYMAPYKQVLMAAFCLKSVRKRTEADAMLGQLAQSWTFERGMRIKGSLLREARKILRNRDISGKLLSKCNQHAFETTVILRALNTAREEGGVLAPAQFVWLRGYDRDLWYPLNNLGRQSYHMEAIGAMCHYKAEKMAQRPIPRPKVENAVKSICDYMLSANARPVPALDYSKSKKRAIKKVKT